MGTKPPLKSMVKNTKKEKIFRPGRSYRERGYAIKEVTITLATVPITVTSAVTPYARRIWSFCCQRYSYASNPNFLGHTL